MVRMRLNWRGPTCSGPRQAVPMQKRVLPASLAASAASSTGSSCIMVVTRAAAVPERADAAGPEVGLVWSGTSMRLKCGTIQNQTPYGLVYVL